MTPVHSLEVIPPCLKRPLSPKRGTLFRHTFLSPKLEMNVNVLERLTLTLIDLGFDVLDGETKVEGECVSGFFVLKSPRQYNDDHDKLAQFQKASLAALTQCFDETVKWPINGSPLNRPAVDPDLISVMQLQRVEGLKNTTIDDTIYNLDVCGVNQAGVLAHLISIISNSGFDIVYGKYSSMPRLNDDRRASWCSAHRVSRSNPPRRSLPLLKTGNRSRCQSLLKQSPSGVRHTVSASAIESTPHGLQDTQRSTSAHSLSTVRVPEAILYGSGSTRFQFHIKPKDRDSICTLRRVLEFPEPQKKKKKKCYLLNRAVHQGPSFYGCWPQENWAVPKGLMEKTNFANGDVYYGELCGNSRQGFGTYEYYNIFEPGARTKYEGQWLGNTKHGYGIGYWQNGDAYAGQWAGNKRSGFGVMITSARNTGMCGRYEGEWFNDMRDGLGAEEKNDSTYFGNFVRGRRRGKGLEIKLHEHKCEVVVREGGTEADDDDCTTSRARLSEALGQYEHGVKATVSTHISSQGSDWSASNGIGTRDLRQTSQDTAKSPMNTVSPSPELLRGPQLGHLLSIIGISECAKDLVSNDGINGEELLNLPDDVFCKRFMMRDVEMLVLKKCLRLLSNHYRDEWSSTALNTYAKVKLPEVAIDSVLSCHLVDPKDVKKVRTISCGGYGTVHEGYWKKVGRIAMKEMHGETGFRNLAELLKEATVSASMNHKNICKFLGIAQNLPRSRYILYEYLPWSLFDLIHIPRGVFDSRPDLTNQRRIVLAKCIACGLGYMHSLGIIHADLKSPNVLVSHGPKGQDITAKLCDFGHAAVRSLPRPHSRLGTPHWAAPEALRGEGIAYPSDVWSFGVICWEMLTSTVPFGGLSTGAVTAAVGWGGKTPADTDKRHCVLGQIATDCMRSLAAERPLMSDLISRLRSYKKVTKPPQDHCFSFLGWLMNNC